MSAKTVRPKDYLTPDAFKRYWLAVAMSVAAAVILRTVFLRADQPWDFTWSQALFTDGARAIDGARSKIVFGTWIPDMRSPVVLFYPLMNIVAFVIFRVGGVGIAQANLAGVIPAITSVVLFFVWMRKLEGDAGGLLGLVMLAFSFSHVVYSRVPMVESLLMLMLLAGFWFALKQGLGLFISGLMIGFASFMVKMHALHFVPVVLVYLLSRPREEDETTGKRIHLAGSFIGGLGVAVVVWVVFIYLVNPDVIAKYFRSNILMSQEGEYTGAGMLDILSRRVSGLLHVASGRDRFFAGAPILSGLAFLGLICVASGVFGGKPPARPWERLAAIWFAGLVCALSLLSYRPLRYMVLLTPSMALLATAFLIRLVRGRLLSSNRPAGFIYAFGIWLGWVLIHVQHDIIYQILTGDGGGPLAPSKAALYRFHLSTLRHVLIFGGASAAVCLLFGKRIRRGKVAISRHRSRLIVSLIILCLVVVNSGKFARYAYGRRYSILDGGRSLERVLSPGVFMVGDCSTTLSLETGFRSLPAYGDLIRYDEKEEFEKYPVTHFLLRFPTLFEYLTKNYPDFAERSIPLINFVLCGREATVVRYPDWPGHGPEPYSPTDYEEAMDLIRNRQPDPACQLLEGFVSKRPDSHEGLSMLAICKLHSGKTEEAKLAAERALELTGRDALSYEVYGDILSSLGRHSEARKQWERASRLNPYRRSLQSKLGPRRR